MYDEINDDSIEGNEVQPKQDPIPKAEEYSIHESSHESTFSDNQFSENNISENNLHTNEFTENNPSTSNPYEGGFTEDWVPASNSHENNFSEKAISESNITENNITESNLTENNVSENNLTEGNISENSFTTSSPMESSSMESSYMESGSTENEIPENNSSNIHENNLSENNVSETNFTASNPMGNSSTENEILENNSSNIHENNLSENNISENSFMASSPMESSSTESSYMESSSAENEIPRQQSFNYRSADDNHTTAHDNNDANSHYAGSNDFSNYYQEPKKSGTGKKFLVTASLAIVFGIVGSIAFQFTNYLGRQTAPSETEVTVLDVVSETEVVQQVESAETVAKVSTSADVTDVVEATMPSIVAITNIGVEEVQGFFYGRSYRQETESAGSGVIVSQNDSELLIATNNHVVSGAEQLTVCFSVDTEDADDLVVEAQVKGTAPERDLAIIAVDISQISADVKNKIRVVEIGDSDNLKVGQQVIAIGNALGYGQSVTVGYVSALDREVTVDDMTNHLIQTDAAINFGNSGGALLNAAGQLIGINSVKAASMGVEGMGYAIPMATAEPILGELMNRTTRSKVAEAEKGYMGVTPVDVSNEARDIYNMPAGAFVYEVSEGSAAETAGIIKGDIIIKIDGATISSRQELFNQMNYYKAGETIEVVVVSAEAGEYKERTVSITLGQRPANMDQGVDQEAEDGQLEEYDEFNPFGGEFDEDVFSFPN